VNKGGVKLEAGNGRGAFRVLGVDPGYERVGIAILERGSGKHTVIHSACLKTSAKMPFPERLRFLGQELENLIADYSPSAMAIEKLYFEKNQKTAMAVSEARGMMLYIAARANLIIEEYTPLQIKCAVTGWGRADKAQIIKMIPLLALLPHVPKYDDEYDAIATAVTCLSTKQ